MVTISNTLPAINNLHNVFCIMLNGCSTSGSFESRTTKISFTASEAWTAEAVNTRADSWCTVSPTSGPAGICEISISVSANETPYDRYASIIIKSGSVSQVIKVFQKQKDALTVTASKFEVGAEGEEINIEVKANVDFECFVEESASNWVVYYDTRAMKLSSLIFGIKNNDSFEKREAKVYIRSGKLSETIRIYQAGMQSTILISQNEYRVASAGETISVEVTSDMDVSVEWPDSVDWIMEDMTRAVSTNTYYFNIAANEGYDSRETEIKFVNKENNVSESVKVVQLQKDAIVLAKNEYKVGSAGGYIDVEVGHNVDFETKISCDWITEVETRALAKESLKFSVSENMTPYEREGEIIFSSGEIVQKLRVLQSPSLCKGNQLKYISSDGKIVQPRVDAYFGGATVVSNEYKNGEGIITFDKDVTLIGEMAFAECANITHLGLPSNLTSIGNYAFYGCTGIVKLNLPESLKSIGDYAFSNCIGISNLTLPKDLTSIGSRAFHVCKRIKTLTLPDNLTSIGAGAFESYSGIESLTFPEGLVSIGPAAFSYCTGITTLTLPGSLTSIGDNAFYGCTGITSLFLPDSLTRIGGGTFYNCKSITTLTLPKNLTSIGAFAFAYISGLSNLSLPSGLKSIDPNAFRGCTGITTLTLPKELTSIGSEAFSDCSGLATLYCEPTNPPSLGTDVFNGTSESLKIYVPVSSESLYKSSWKDYEGKIYSY